MRATATGQHARMRRKAPLSPLLRPGAVRTADRASHGMSPKRLRQPDVDHPFTGVSAAGLDLDTVRGACTAYKPLLAPHDAFSHSTAMALFGAPLPREQADPLPVHITSPAGRRRTGRNVVGHETDVVSRTIFAGLPVVEPEIAWCQPAASISPEDLVALADFLVTPVNGFTFTTIDRLRAVVAQHGGRRGAIALRWALTQVRVGPRSRPESLLRLLLVAHGLPEPVVAPEVVLDGLIVHPDLAYPRWRIAIEYEGDGHRTSEKQWRRDLTRYELLQDAGWRVIRVHADDLFGNPLALVERISRVIHAREA